MISPEHSEYAPLNGNFLTEVPLLPVSEAQVAMYGEKVVKGVVPYDHAEVVSALLDFNGKRVWGTDAGANSLKAVEFTADNGFLYPTGEVLEVPANKTGASYLALYQEVGSMAADQNVPVGISSAGKVGGLRLIEVPNVPDFTAAFVNNPLFHGDFSRIVPTVESLDNDAQAAGRYAVAYAAQLGYLPKDLRGRSFIMEPGHVEALNLRRHPDQKIDDAPCGFEGNPKVCLENTVGGESAIKQRWLYLTGQNLSADKIAGRYRNGTPQEQEWARSIYAASVDGFAEAIAGMGKVTQLLRGTTTTGLILPINGGGLGGWGLVVDSEVPIGQRGTVVAFHGGVNRERGYDDRVIAKLTLSGRQPSRNFYTENVTKYPGAMGAAMGAIVARQRRLARR